MVARLLPEASTTVLGLVYDAVDPQFWARLLLPLSQVPCCSAQLSSACLRHQYALIQVCVSRTPGRTVFDMSNCTR